MEFSSNFLKLAICPKDTIDTLELKKIDTDKDKDIDHHNYDDMNWVDITEKWNSMVPIIYGDLERFERGSLLQAFE